MNGTTSIHQHSFCGAFSLLHGKSINTEFQFTKNTRINSHCYLGNLNFKDNLILIPGMVRKILPGNNLIHSLFHLDAPSITIVIRNNVCADHKPQLDYYSPHIAIDGEYKDKAFDRRVQCMQLMLQDAKAHAHKILETFIIQANLHQIFMLFKKIRLYQFEQDHIDKISDLIIKKVGGDLLLKTINEQYKYQRLTSLRQLVKDKDQRIILAVLRTTPSKKNIINNFLQLLNIQDKTVLVKIFGQFINQTSTMGAVGYSYCHDAEKIAEIMLKDYTETEISEEINKLDNSAKNCYTGLKKSFIFQNWFTPNIHTNEYKDPTSGQFRSSFASA